MAFTLPLTLPAAHKTAAGVVSVPDVDMGGYDFMVGGHGFRQATDQQFAYARATEPTTSRRFDDSAEPGEQSLSPLPWIKSQASFHAGAGQQNLEQGFTAFQYQQEQIEHIRFDTCLGVDVWTPGKVSRLPDTTFFNFGFDSKAVITATLGGIDYAIIGGTGGLYQAKWAAGPDAAPTVTRISLANSTYVSDANCTVTSLATDGANYFGIVQMATVGYNPSILTYVFAGQVDSTATPEAIYRIPNLIAGSTLHNLCPNPSFETNTTGWHSCNWGALPVFAEDPVSGATIARDTSQHYVGSASLRVQEPTTPVVVDLPNSKLGDGALFEFTSVIGTTYTFSAYVYAPSVGFGVPVGARKKDSAGGTLARGSATSALDALQRVELTFTATSTLTYLSVGADVTPPGGGTYYVDAVMVQAGSWTFGAYFDGATAGSSSYTYSWEDRKSTRLN